MSIGRQLASRDTNSFTTISWRQLAPQRCRGSAQKFSGILALCIDAMVVMSGVLRSMLCPHSTKEHVATGTPWMQRSTACLAVVAAIHVNMVSSAV